jgi:isopenicillin-N N-acyltransferase-like protein
VSWPVVLASGGPRERGRAYGVAAAPRIGASLELYEAVFHRYAGLAWSEVRRRAGAFVPHLDAYDVELLPEIEGIAEGAAVDAEDVLALNLRTEVMFGLDASRTGTDAGPTRECTAVGLRHVDGGPIVAQNWDWKPAVRDTCIVLACAPYHRPAFVTVVEAGLLAKFGLNDQGVAVATNALTSSRDRGEPGVPYHAVLRRILTSETFDEAVAAVREGPRASSANYLIGSADGRLVDLETTPGGPDDVHAAEGERLVHANHFTWPTPRPFRDVGRVDGEDSVQRHATTERAVATGGPSVDDVMAALRDHTGRPSSVCAHDDPSVEPVEDYVTVAAFVAALGSGRTWVTQGNPCEQPFEPLPAADLLARARREGSARASAAP